MVIMVGHAEDDAEKKQTLVNTNSIPGTWVLPQYLWHRYNIISIVRFDSN